MEEVLKWRKKFPTLEDNIHLINHSQGCMPQEVYANLKFYADSWSQKHLNAWDEAWWDMNTNIGNVIADIINAPHNTISMHPNVTTAAAILLSCFEFTKAKDTIVSTELDYPSVSYLINAYTPGNARKSIVGSEDGIRIPTENILDAIDDRTHIVSLSHIFYRSSAVQDVDAIVEKAHAHGAFVMLDAYQAVGVYPLDVRKSNIDAVMGGSIKWLCGGPGVAFLYVSPAIGKKLKPKFTGWIGHEEPMDFADEMKHSEDLSFRFLNGTPQIPALFSVKAGFEIIKEAGIQYIRERSLSLTKRIITYVQNNGLALNSPVESEKRGGTVVIKANDGKTIAKELVKRNVLVDWRPRAGIRISPHFYNTEDEVDSAMEEMGKLLIASAYNQS